MCLEFYLRLNPLLLVVPPESGDCLWMEYSLTSNWLKRLWVFPRLANRGPRAPHTNDVHNTWMAHWLILEIHLLISLTFCLFIHILGCSSLLPGVGISILISFSPHGSTVQHGYRYLFFAGQLKLTEFKVCFVFSTWLLKYSNSTEGKNKFLI